MRAGRLQIGDVVRYQGPDDEVAQTGTVIGHPSYAPSHDVVVIAPDPPVGRVWHVYSDDWCGMPDRRDIGRARRERFRLRQGKRRDFLERPQPGWSR